MGIVIGILIVLAVAAFLAVRTCKSNASDLFSWVFIIILIAFCLTWIVPYGSFQGVTFVEQGMKRLGLTDIPTVMYYAVYFCLTTVIYLFVLGGFYGVISKTKGYNALVKKCGKFIQGKEIGTSIVLIIVLVALTSIIKNTMALLVFIPLLVSILLNAKFDKITAMGVTFGSLLVGLLGATYGTEGLYWFNSYASTTVTVGIYHRLVFGLFALVVFIIFNVIRISKMTKKKVSASEVKDDLFLVEDVKDKKTKTWPIVLVYVFLFVFIILGYIDWNTNFKIEAFGKFHTWLTELSIGEDFTIFNFILGTNSVAFGSFEISVMIILLLISSMLVGLMNRQTVKEYASNFAEGFAKMFKPIMLYVLTYAAFIITYLTPIFATVNNWAFGLTKSFNPFITTITAFVTSIFHADLGYTSYLIGGLMTANSANLTIIHTIYVTMYGFAQVIAPTSGILLIGLAYLKLDYKQWLKYIWAFALIMLVIFVIFITIATYVI